MNLFHVKDKLQWKFSLSFSWSFIQVWWTASDIGWVVGHSYIVYAPLLNRCTSVFFEVSLCVLHEGCFEYLFDKVVRC